MEEVVVHWGRSRTGQDARDNLLRRIVFKARTFSTEDEVISRLCFVAVLLATLLNVPPSLCGQTAVDSLAERQFLHPIVGFTAGPVVSWFSGTWSIWTLVGDSIVPGSPRDAIQAGWGWSAGIDLVPKPDDAVLAASVRFQHLTAELTELTPVSLVLVPDSNRIRDVGTTARTSYTTDLLSLEAWVGVPAVTFRGGCLLIVGGVEAASVIANRLRRDVQADRPMTNSAMPTEDNGRRVVLYDDRVPGLKPVLMAAVIGFRGEYRVANNLVVSVETRYAFAFAALAAEMRVSSVRFGIGVWLVL